jgi:predicted CopG family antitoxin
MIRTQVYLPEELYNEVKLLSMSGEGSFSDLLREGLKAVVQAKRKTKKSSFIAWKNFIGACKTDFGGKSGQDLIDDYYKNDVV